MSERTRSGRGSARARLLAAAADCFYDHGIGATGIDTITATAGVAKMSLYNNFAGKDELVLAYLEARHEEEVEALLAAHLAEVDGVPAGRVADLAEELSFLLEGAMARAGLEGDSRRLHRVRDLTRALVRAAAGEGAQ